MLAGKRVDRSSSEMKALLSAALAELSRLLGCEGRAVGGKAWALRLRCCCCWGRRVMQEMQLAEGSVMGLPHWQRVGWAMGGWTEGLWSVQDVERGLDRSGGNPVVAVVRAWRRRSL